MEAWAGTYVSVPKVFIDESGKPVEAEQGLFLVPENRARTQSRTVSIHFLRFRALEPGSGRRDSPRAPVFLLPGGPGEELNFAKKRDMRAVTRLRRTRDVVYVSQRGNPDSPGLVPALWASYQATPLSEPASAERTRERQRQAVGTALAEWSGRGIDLSGYDILNAVDDVHELRSALGYDRIILRGCSFGSQWSLAYLQRWPETVDRALLSGVEPLDHAYDSPQWIWDSMSRVARSAESAPQMANRIPQGGLLRALQKTIERLEKAPASVEIEDPATGRAVSLVVGANDLREIVAGASGLMGKTAHQNLANWPRLILELHQGDYRYLAVRSWLRRRAGSQEALIIALIDNSLGITAKRDALLQSEPAARWLGDVNDLYRNTRDLVPTPDVGDAFRAGSKITVPVLLLNGDFDWSTPIENSRQLRKSLAHGHLVTVSGGTHCTEDQELPDLLPHDLETIYGFIDADFGKRSADELFRSMPDTLAYPRLAFNAPEGPSLYEQWLAKQKGAAGTR